MMCAWCNCTECIYRLCRPIYLFIYPIYLSISHSLTLSLSLYLSIYLFLSLSLSLSFFLSFFLSFRLVALHTSVSFMRLSSFQQTPPLCHGEGRVKGRATQARRAKVISK